MNENDKWYLWPHEAPFTAECKGQEQPSITAFPVTKARGAVIVCPGGAYEGKAPHEGVPVAKMLNEAGIAAFVLDYRVAPCPHEAPLTDAKRAIRLVRSLGYPKVGILGFSAGGHLCCMAATLFDQGTKNASDPIERLSARPDAFIPCYPVVSFQDGFVHARSRLNLLGDLAEDDLLRHRYSADEQVSESTPPAFIWHTVEDGLVPVQNSLLLARALADHKVSFEMHIYPKGEHGMGLAGGRGAAASWTSDCCAWLLQQGFGQ